MADIGNTFSDFDEQSNTLGSPVDDSTTRSSDYRIEAGRVSQGTFEGDDILDYYEFQTIAGHAYQIIVTSDGLYGWNQFDESTAFDFDVVVDDSIFPTPLFSSVNGSDVFTQEVTFTAPETGTFHVRIDGKGEEFDYGATINDLGSSSQPTAIDDGFYIDFNTALSVDIPSGLLRNDSDPDLDPVTVTGSNYAGPGNLQVNANGSFTYTPAPDFFGADTFTYTISDNNGGSATASATINVDPEPPFLLEVFDNCGHPLEGDAAFPGTILAFRPSGSFPGQASQYLSELGPIELLCRETGTNDPFQSFATLQGDRNAIAVGENLVGMDVIAQAQNAALFQTNIVPISVQPVPPPDPNQSFGSPLVKPDPNTPGAFLIDTNTVDDLIGFGSPPSFCVEVAYLKESTGTIETFTLDINALVTQELGGAKVPGVDLNTKIQEEFDNIKAEGDELIQSGVRGREGEQWSYNFIEFRFIKKYTDSNGDAKIVKATHFQRVLVEDDGTVSIFNSFETLDFTSATPEPDAVANIIGNGGGGSDLLFGGSNTNLLDGAGGNDRLIGSGSSDALSGGAGDDDGVAGPGFTYFDGGVDDDTFHLNGNYFDFILLRESTDGPLFNTHILDTRPGNPLSKNVVKAVERLGFRDGELNLENGVFRPHQGFAPDGTPVTGSTSFNGVVMDGQVLIDFEAFPPPPLDLQQGLSFGQEALTESTNGVLVFNGSTYTIDPPFDAYLDLREDEGRIEVFVTDADYYNFAPPGTVDQSFSITVTNDQGTETYDFPFFIGRPDVAPVTDLGLSAATVSENADAGTVIGAAQPTFVDDPEVEEDFLLQISGADAALFEFDDAGNLIVADGADIDFETQQAANIIISTTNLNGDTFEKAVEVTIDNMPISEIAMTSGGSVREGAPDNAVVATFEASENPVEPTATFAIVSGGDGLFYLDGNELKVAPGAGAVFDFDNQSNYFITFSATDGTGPAHEESFDIFVENVGPILGTPDPDVLNGTRFDDVIKALASDDTINGSDGSDEIDGDEGNDTVSYSDPRAGYTQTLLANGTVTLAKPGGDTDTLIEIERIDFIDGDYIYDLASPNLGFIYRIYEATFNRTPDEGGLRFWVGEADLFDQLGWSEYDKQHQIARIFHESLEFELIFGDNTTNYEYVDAMYRNVLNRPPDQEGHDYWTWRMDQGASRAEILVFFSESVENRIFTDPHIDDGVWVV